MGPVGVYSSVDADVITTVSPNDIFTASFTMQVGGGTTFELAAFVLNVSLLNRTA
jgi:hypothetical protein